MRSVPTKTTPCATTAWLYLPPTLSWSGVVRQSNCIVFASKAYNTGCGTLGPTSEAERYTFASSTQTIALMEPLLVTMGGPGLNKPRTESAEWIEGYTGWHGSVTTLMRASPGGTGTVEHSDSFVAPDMNR